MIRTFDPSNFIFVVGVIPMLEWTNLTYTPRNDTTMIQGLDEVPLRLRLKGGELSVFSVEIEYSSPINKALKALKLTEIPFPCAIAMRNNYLPPLSEEALRAFNLLGISPAADVSGVGSAPAASALFMWPCTFAGDPVRLFGRKAGLMRWDIIGKTRLDTLGGLND